MALWGMRSPLIPPALILALAAACATPPREKRQFKYRPSKDQQCKLEHFEDAERPQRPYESLGLLPYTGGLLLTRKERAAGLQQVGCRAGADAVVLHDQGRFEVGGRLHRRWEAELISYDLRTPEPPARPAPDVIVTPPPPPPSLTPTLDAMLGLGEAPDGGS